MEIGLQAVVSVLQQPKETTRYDETMNVKALLRELCQVRWWEPLRNKLGRGSGGLRMLL